jgi:hypothetical protein
LINAGRPSVFQLLEGRRALLPQTKQEHVYMIDPNDGRFERIGFLNVFFSQNLERMFL